MGAVKEKLTLLTNNLRKGIKERNLYSPKTLTISKKFIMSLKCLSSSKTLNLYIALPVIVFPD